MARAKRACDGLIAEAYRAQAHALAIRARADLGLRRDEIYEARRLRDAERAGR